MTLDPSTYTIVFGILLTILFSSIYALYLLFNLNDSIEGEDDDETKDKN